MCSIEHNAPLCTSFVFPEYAVAESTVLDQQETSFQHSQGLLSLCAHFVAMVTTLSVYSFFLESVIQRGSDDVSHDQQSHDHRPHAHKLTVRLLKDSLHGLGINIVDLTEPESSGGVTSSRGIVVDSIVKGGPADTNGILQRGMVCAWANIFR